MKRIGILDIGSNSMRLSIIAQMDNGGYYVIDEQKATPRLANYVNDHILAPEGIQKLIDHLREFRGICQAFDVNEVIAVGTAALRKAKNRDQIIDLVASTTGFMIDVITGSDEALFGVSAVKHTMDLQDAYLIDIGGASTEITLIKNGTIIASHSFGVGAVTAHAVLQANPQAIDQLFLAKDFLFDSPQIELIGIGGTIRNIARIHQAHTHYPLSITHNYTMDHGQVREIVHWLSLLPIQRLRKTEGLSKDRVDLIVPGGQILLSAMTATKTSQLRISGRGLRDGAFYTRVLGEPDGPRFGTTVLESSVINTLRRFSTSENHATHVTKLASLLYQAAIYSQILPIGYERVLYASAMLHRIGIQVSYYSYDLHTFYLIFSSSINGLSHKEIVMTAAISSYKSRRRMMQLCQPYQSLFQDGDFLIASQLGTLVRLAESLDRRHEKRIHTFDVTFTGQDFIITLPKTCDAEVEIAAAMAYSPYVKKTFAKNLIIKKA